jgi:hypothetical protein
MKSGAVLTERQQKWFATVEANFEKATGRPVAVWVDILKGCPETRPKAQAAWLKATHGIGANHAAHILNAARPDDAMGWDDAEALRAALWSEPRSLAILEAIERAAANVDSVISGQRKGYTSFSRAVQFAATRPLKGGRALLGLKLDPIQNTPLGSAVEAAQSSRVRLPATTPTVARNDDRPTLTISEAAKAA